MQFTKRLRDKVRRGEVTSSIRIWTRPHVKVGGRYRMESGEVEVDAIVPTSALTVHGQRAESQRSGRIGEPV